MANIRAKKHRAFAPPPAVVALSPDAAPPAPRPEPPTDVDGCANHIRVSPFVVANRNWRDRVGIPYFYIGRHVRFFLSDVERWARARQRGGVS